MAASFVRFIVQVQRKATIWTIKDRPLGWLVFEVACGDSLFYLVNHLVHRCVAIRNATHIGDGLGVHF